MTFPGFVARRLVSASRKSRYFSWISALTMSGIAISVAAMIVVLSVINGFEHELRRRLMVANAHVMLYRFPYGIDNPEAYERTLRERFGDEVVSVGPFVYQETAARYRNLMEPVTVRGVAAAPEGGGLDFSGMVQPRQGLDMVLADDGSGGVAPVILGRDLMGLLGLKEGDVFELISTDDSVVRTPVSFRAIGRLNTGLSSYDRKFILMSMPRAQAFFGMRQAVTGLEIGLREPLRSREIGEAMAAATSLTLKEWQSLNKTLFAAMKTERVVIALIVAMVSLVASFNILTSMFVAVSQKQRDISILKALGASNVQVGMIFLNQGLLLGFAGAAAGIAAAFLLNELLARYEIVKLPEIYILTRLPVEQDPWLFGGVATASLLLAAAATVMPVWLATRVQPGDGFQMRGTLEE